MQRLAKRPTEGHRPFSKEYVRTMYQQSQQRASLATHTIDNNHTIEEFMQALKSIKVGAIKK